MLDHCVPSALIEEFGLNEEDDVGEGNTSISLEKAVLCADDAARPNIDSLVNTHGLLRGSSELLGSTFMSLAATCVGWPEALDPVVDIQTNSAPESLVIGGSEDVVTPVSWAIETADAIGGVFLLSEHQRHTTVFTRENDCVDSLVVDFLLEGSLPPAGTVCN